MNKKIHEFSVVILEDESRGYIAVVPELPGCHTQGDSLDEVIRNVREAIELYLETLSEKDKARTYKDHYN
ncbi:MAG: type II toxin-antitoxin system HicB family antitoxin [Crenarchaeota archaeon]|nr:type II toxin-antitoxin system HicB family antitoxin [Thermoproteota archaeon]